MPGKPLIDRGACARPQRKRQLTSAFWAGATLISLARSGIDGFPLSAGNAVFYNFSAENLRQGAHKALRSAMSFQHATPLVDALYCIAHPRKISDSPLHLGAAFLCVNFVLLSELVRVSGVSEL